MPKIKTAKGIKRRFKITRTGKVVARRAGRRHLLSGKPHKIKRHMRRPTTLHRAEAEAIKALAPYA